MVLRLRLKGLVFVERQLCAKTSNAIRDPLWETTKCQKERAPF